MVDLTKMVEPAGRYASCLRSPLLSSVGPSTIGRWSSESQRPPRRRSFVPQRSPPLPDPEPWQVRPPEFWQVRYRVPRIVPGVTDQRYPKRCRTTSPNQQRRALHCGSVRGRRYHRI